MGVVASTLSSYYDVHFMNAHMEIDYRFQQISQFELAYFAGLMSQQAGSAAAGVSSASTGGPGKAPYLIQMWRSVNWGLHGLSPIMMFFGVISIIICFALNLSSIIMLAGGFMFFTFFIHTVLYNTSFGQAQLMYSSIPLWSIVGGIILASITAFAIYLPLWYNRKD